MTTTNHLTPAELDALLEAAKAADTQGEWRAINSPAEIELTLDHYLNARSLQVAAPACSSRYGLIPQGVVSANDARFIAAANPATIERLVLMVRELQQENAQLRLPIRAQATTETIFKQSVEHFRARAVRAIEALEIDTTHDHFYLTGYYRARGDARYRIKSMPLVETEEE